MNKYPVVPGFDTSLLDRSFAPDPHSVTTCSGFFPENNSSCPNITAVENLMHWGNSQNPHGAFLKTRFDEGSEVVNLADSQNEQRARSEQAIQEAITAERNRLARELHDAVTQTLFSASLNFIFLKLLGSLVLSKATIIGEISTCPKFGKGW